MHKKCLFDRTIVPCVALRTCNSAPVKISKILSEWFVSSRCGVKIDGSMTIYMDVAKFNHNKKSNSPLASLAEDNNINN